LSHITRQFGVKRDEVLDFAPHAVDGGRKSISNLPIYPKVAGAELRVGSLMFCNFSATGEAKGGSSEHGCCGSGVGGWRTGSGKALWRQPSVGLFLDP